MLDALVSLCCCHVIDCARASCCLFLCCPLLLCVTWLHCIAGITDVKDVGYVIVSGRRLCYTSC
jgi:hypothetical protein